jgi:hypothetical protein
MNIAVHPRVHPSAIFSKPPRDPNMREEINQCAVVIWGTLIGIVTSLASGMGPGPIGGPNDLWDDSRFVMTCVAGSLAGALLLITLPHAAMTARKMAMEVFFSGLTGVIFSPAMIDYCHITRTTTWVLPTSAIVAMLGVGLLRTVVPALRTLFVDVILRKFAAFFGISKPPGNE